LFQPDVSDCVVEAQWRPAGGGRWRQAPLHQCLEGRADFRVRAVGDAYHSGEALRVLAALRGAWVASYVFGDLSLEAGEQRVVVGIGDGAFADNVLLAPGEFHYQGKSLEVVNLGPSVECFSEALDAPALLEAAPGACSRNLFAV